jgi:predicted anti-sigma-YlaC factor YlaD
MNCLEGRESPEMLLAYCAGTLDRARVAAIEEHLKICVACRDFVAGQKAVWSALDAWEAAPVSPDFNRRLYARIEKEVSVWDLILRPFRPLLVRQGLPVAAAAAVVIMAGFLIERPAGLNPGTTYPFSESANMESVAPEQAEQTLQEMEMMRELNRLVHPENADSKI